MKNIIFVLLLFCVGCGGVEFWKNVEIGEVRVQNYNVDPFSGGGMVDCILDIKDGYVLYYSFTYGIKRSVNDFYFRDMTEKSENQEDIDRCKKKVVEYFDEQK